MFISKKDLETLEIKLREEFDNKLEVLRQEVTLKPRQVTKKKVK